MKLQTLATDALAKRAGAQGECGENERPGAGQGAPPCAHYLDSSFPRNPMESVGRAVPAREEIFLQEDLKRKQTLKSKISFSAELQLLWQHAGRVFQHNTLSSFCLSRLSGPSTPQSRSPSHSASQGLSQRSTETGTKENDKPRNCGG